MLPNPIKKNLICLLIDDDQDDQELFALTLEDIEAPINLNTANNGEEALEWLEENLSALPDYIFLDLNMPRMGGKECLKLIKEHQHLSSIPVVIFSTSSEHYDIKETRALGALDFITKPARTSELATILRDFFMSHEPHLLTPNANHEK